MASGCDAAILDLEASVPEREKEVARRAICECLQTIPRVDGPEVWVRVNSGAEFTADVEKIDWRQVAGAVVPKAEDPDVLHTLKRAGAKSLIPLIESAAGFGALNRLAQVPSVERFAIGTWDLSLDLGLFAVSDPDDSELIWQLRGTLVVKSRELGLKAPVDGVYTRLQDDTGFHAVCERVLRLGYGGKLLIHPNQIATAQSVFERSGRPDAEELQAAREVVDAYERAERTGRGAIQVRGQMIDRPIVEKARALLARWPGALTP